MREDDSHLSEQDLLLAADGELPKSKTARVSAHLARCWTCRARMRELEDTISEFVQMRDRRMPALPPANGPRALLKLRLAQLSQASEPGLWDLFSGLMRRRAVGLALTAGLALLIGGIGLRHVQSERSSRIAKLNVRSVPDPQITPGATLPLTRDDVCDAGTVEASRVVPVDVAKKVFAAYGVSTPEPRAYEVDYLITPALGGSDNIRNFWPQPYKNTVWNAHIKDALEDYLQKLVCTGQLELPTAQHEIAADWISAYKRYFDTELPLREHVAFLKDRPWE